MDTQRRWIGYDTFKLIVTLLLLALLLILYLQRPSVNPSTGTGEVNPVAAGGAAQQPASAQQPVAPTDTTVPPTTAPTNTTAPTDTPVKPTATPTMPPPTPTATAAAAAAAAPTTAPAETATPAPTEASAAAPTATAQAQSASTSTDCPLAAPSHLAVGKQAVVITNLNMRESAGMDKTIRLVSQPSSKLTVIGGPTCVPYQDGAYLWWEVKTQDGATGWSAEASLSKTFYFLQPAP